MQGTIVAVIRGGPSHEHEISLKSGHAIIKALPTERFTVRDIYIDKQGQWHERGKPTTPEKSLRMMDLALIGLHGQYGEDGTVQKVLERLGVPYTGSNSFSSFLAMHKLMARERARELGIKTPQYRFIQASDDPAVVVHDAIRSFHPPVVVKPVRWGPSVGISVVSGYASVLNEVMKFLEAGADGVLIEERIEGKKATTGVIENMRGERLYALPPTEIINVDADRATEICPARFPRKISEELMKTARVMHQALGLRHYSYSDFIVSPRGIYYLKTNSLPYLTPESLLPKSLAAVGIKFSDFLSHLVDLALARK